LAENERIVNQVTAKNYHVTGSRGEEKSKHMQGGGGEHER